MILQKAVPCAQWTTVYPGIDVWHEGPDNFWRVRHSRAETRYSQEFVVPADHPLLFALPLEYTLTGITREHRAVYLTWDDATSESARVVVDIQFSVDAEYLYP